MMSDTVGIISKAIETSLDRRLVRRVMVEPSVDSEGDAALDVTIVLDDSDPSGTEAITILVAIRDALSAAGDERFPIIEYTTEDELALDDGAEA